MVQLDSVSRGRFKLERRASVTAHWLDASLNLRENELKPHQLQASHITYSTSMVFKVDASVSLASISINIVSI